MSCRDSRETRCSFPVQDWASNVRGHLRGLFALSIYVLASSLCEMRDEHIGASERRGVVLTDFRQSMKRRCHGCTCSRCDDAPDIDARQNSSTAHRSDHALLLYDRT